MKIILILLGTLLLASSHKPAEIVASTGVFPDSVYLSDSVLTAYRDQAQPMNFPTFKQVPFDSLQFDKVIAYDFDGNHREYRSVFGRNKGGLVPVILDQMQLGEKQVTQVVHWLTDSATYGNVVAACFEPSMALVFYMGSKPSLVVDICLDCNRLVTSMDIPAHKNSMLAEKNRIMLNRQGFSNPARMELIALSKSLGLAYGDFKHPEFGE